jgi:hypothetical protein
VRAEIDELLEANLVRRQSEGRGELLELVRAFASEELVAADEEDEARTRHRRYFAELVTPAIAAFDGGVAPGEVAASMLADHANVREAAEDAIAAADQETALALALGLRPLWLAGMLRQEAQELAERLLDRFDVPGEREVAWCARSRTWTTPPPPRPGTGGWPRWRPGSAITRRWPWPPATCSARRSTPETSRRCDRCARPCWRC